MVPAQARPGLGAGGEHYGGERLAGQSLPGPAVGSHRAEERHGREPECPHHGLSPLFFGPGARSVIRGRLRVFLRRPDNIAAGPGRRLLRPLARRVHYRVFICLGRGALGLGADDCRLSAGCQRQLSACFSLRRGDRRPGSPPPDTTAGGFSNVCASTAQ